MNAAIRWGSVRLSSRSTQPALVWEKRSWLCSSAAPGPGANRPRRAGSELPAGREPQPAYPRSRSLAATAARDLPPGRGTVRLKWIPPAARRTGHCECRPS
ncbi:MAG: hypothetical protein PVG14_12525 [Anaerolineales bacterium]